MMSPEEKPTTITSGRIADHYARVGHALEELGRIDDAATPGNVDFYGWYRQDNQNAPIGCDGRARPWVLTADYEKLAQRVDRTLYATVNYVDREFFASSWDGFNWVADDGKRERDWASGDGPLPGYAHIEAYAPYADIDLKGDAKVARANGEDYSATVAPVIEHYVDAFADLGRGSDAVHVLDSVGGVYVMLAPTVTAPIADAFNGAERAEVYDELTNRLNSWLDGVWEDAVEQFPGVEELLDPDDINHKNRLYKVPLSVHKSVDGVVTPIDTDAPAYEFTHLSAVGDDLLEDTHDWCRSFTADYSDRVASVVAGLWPHLYGEHQDWEATLRAWLDTQKEEEKPASPPPEKGETSSELAPMESVFDAVAQLDIEAVAEKTIVHKWNDGAGTSANKRAFYPIWGANSNGTANYVDVEQGIWHDTGAGEHGTAVEMALIKSGVSWRRGEIANGADYVRGVEELRKLGFDVPLPRSTPDDGQSPYYGLPLQSIAREKIGDSTDLYADREKLLKACLYARDEYASDLDDEKPPYKVLLEVAEVADLIIEDPEEGRLGKDAHRLARIVFDDLSIADVD